MDDPPLYPFRRSRCCGRIIRTFTFLFLLGLQIRLRQSQLVGRDGAREQPIEGDQFRVPRRVATGVHLVGAVTDHDGIMFETDC